MQTLKKLFNNFFLHKWLHPNIALRKGGGSITHNKENRKKKRKKPLSTSRYGLGPLERFRWLQLCPDSDDQTVWPERRWSGLGAGQRLPLVAGQTHFPRTDSGSRLGQMVRHVQRASVGGWARHVEIPLTRTGGTSSVEEEIEEVSVLMSVVVFIVRTCTLCGTFLIYAPPYPTFKYYPFWFHTFCPISLISFLTFLWKIVRGHFQEKMLRWNLYFILKV